MILCWFRLGFRGLSSYSSGILFLHPFLVPTGVWNSFGVLFPHHFLVPARVPGLVSLLFWYPVTSSFLGSGWGSGACLTTLLASCSIISWFRLGYRGLSYGILFHHRFLVPARVPGFVFLLLASCSIIIFWSRLGFRGLSPYFFGILSCSIIIFWFRLGFRLFHHHFLVPARVPGLVSLLFWHPVTSSFPASG